MDLFYHITMCHGLGMVFPNLVFPLNDSTLEAAVSRLTHPPSPTAVEWRGELEAQ